ncbi:tetratricopeptide repeat protein [bacterium]|nr:tetratricopeptide repeat protein [bacterium]MBP9810938.1 tetratricopeptide repeat protein [bacterium]
MFRKSIVISGACVLLTAVSGWILSAQAADFEQGCQFYKSKNYAQARASFERAVKAFPENWLVHYYLANTYLLSNQSASATREYEACLKYKPNAVTAKYCQDAIWKLTGVAPAASDSSISQDSAPLAEPENPGTPAGKIDNKADSKSDSKADVKPDVKEAASQAIVAADQARAEAILKRAREECKTIRAEAKERIANGRHTGNQWYRLPDGTRYVDLRDEEKDAITKEAEDRCDAIMRTAESSAARLQH